MTRLTDEQLEAMEARVDAELQRHPRPLYYVRNHVQDGEGVKIATFNHMDDALFFLDCRADVPALISEIRRLRGLVDAVRQLADELKAGNRQDVGTAQDIERALEEE